MAKRNIAAAHTLMPSSPSISLGRGATWPQTPRMNSADLRPFEIEQVAAFADTPEGLTRLRITTALCEAELYLQGAHLTHFKPSHSEPVLFVSEDSHYSAGQPIRGGVPICFPWFGPRAGDPGAPSHGFARILPWKIESLDGSVAHGATVRLSLASDAATRKWWPHEFKATLQFEFTRQLQMTLRVENLSPGELTFEEALHTYLSVSDVRNIAVSGLEGATYLDKTENFRRKKESDEPLKIVGETDRLYPSTQAACTIADPDLKRRLVVEKSGSETTVVWNPWEERAKALGDFGDDEWPRMLCVETANAGENAVRLAAGASFEMTALVRLG